MISETGSNQKENPLEKTAQQLQCVMQTLEAKLDCFITRVKPLIRNVPSVVKEEVAPKETQASDFIQFLRMQRDVAERMTYKINDTLGALDL